MGRLVWYAGVSTALAGGVIVSAFNQRANFYSACVYLAQSNLCLMVLINLILFIYGTFMYGLQRLCYGPLRPIEVEQLYEKSWFAITETCLAMTIFREEVGAWFLVMFVALLTGKVWGWIGDGRVEVLEQQPPANPRLFHMRLSLSLGMSVIYDLWLMNYIISTVIQQARPNMMVMFLFEFAILTTSSCATAFRYSISLIEASVVKKQTQERLAERRREVRDERDEMIRQRAAAAAAGDGSDTASSNAALPSEDDVDEMDIEVPGWEAKGQWVLTLDLFTDFVKLGIYIAFFGILLMFYGLPIHIMRDLFMTARSFAKRLAAFLRYRRATRDMNEKYEDATVEDIQREDTCIICREEMRPWSVTNPQAPPAVPGALPPARPAATVNERMRPKKLPCGHILHLGCLKSWLERQQVCPTCRRPVADTPQNPQPGGAANNANPAGQGAQRPLPGQQDGVGGHAPARAHGRGMRMLNIGPLRVGFGQANLQDLAALGAPQPGQENAAGGGPRVYGLELGFPRRVQAQPQAADATTTMVATTVPDHLQQIEQHILGEIRNLQITQQELQLVQLLQAELARLRAIRNGGVDPLTANFQMPQIPHSGLLGGRHNTPNTLTVPHMQRHGARSNMAVIPAGSVDLPAGVTIPEGWSLLPLQRLDSVTPVPQAGIVAGPAGVNPSATTQRSVSPTTGAISNNTLTPTPTINPENQSQASSVNSSDANTIHSPPSVAADPSSAPSLNTTLPSTTTLNNVSESNNMHGEPSLLPHRASNQLFSGTSRNSTTNGTSASSSGAPVSVQREESSTGIRPSGVSSYAGASTAKSGEEKGKGKAVTIEDADDEAGDA